MDKVTDYNKLINDLTEPKHLHLSQKNFGDGDMQSLAQALANSQVIYLDLSYNKIGCNGLKFLAEVLKSTAITTLRLNNNIISDNGAECLSAILKDTAIKELNLHENKISFKGALHLGSALRGSKIKTFYLDIYHEQDTTLIKCLSHHFDGGIANVEIKLEDNRIGELGAKYLYDTFYKSGITKIELSSRNLSADDAYQCLARAFKHMKICDLQIPKNHFTQYHGPKYLIYIFQDSHINTLYAGNLRLGESNINRLAEFLQGVKIFNLDIHYNFLKEEGMRILAPVLKNTDIMYISLSKNFITSEGAKFLSEVLPDSKLLKINLCNNEIGVNGAKYLANGLSNSQVTNINLHGNAIQYQGYKYLFNDVENTNLTSINLHQNDIEAGFDNYRDFRAEFVPRTTTPVAVKLRNAFKELVVQDESNKEFEFSVPKNDVHPSIDVDEYAFLIGTLKSDPKLKIHIYDMKWNPYGHNHVIFGKIDEFLDQITSKFNAFVNDKLHDLLSAFANHNFVSLVKKFEEMGLSDNVNNLLLHRILYYVDENEEILHPYIYKLLSKYNLPLYNEQIEPTKREKIISYYEIHQEFEGAQEIVDVLKSTATS